MALWKLANNGTPTTSLGFGCAYLVSGFEQRKSTALIHAALDAGVNHFDVAPMYGMGTAENALGISLAGRRGKVTIASKAGLGRPNIPSVVMLARALAAPLRKRFSGFTASVGSKLIQKPRGQFGVADVERSLSETLRRLKTDYLDLFLLHEAQPDDLSDELLRFMEDIRQKGIAVAIGVASERSACEKIALNIPDLFDVFQYSWSALDSRELAIPKARFIITHRAILHALRPISAWLAHTPEARIRLSSATGFNLDSENALADLLLGAALSANRLGVVLTASRRTQRVKRFGAIMNDDMLKTAGAKFAKALLSEHGGLQLQDRI